MDFYQSVLELRLLLPENSLLFPTFFSTPISNEEAMSIVVHKLNITKYNVFDFSTMYVYLKGDGSIFESNINSNWKIYWQDRTNNNNRKLFYMGNKK